MVSITIKISLCLCACFFLTGCLYTCKCGVDLTQEELAESMERYEKTFSTSDSAIKKADTKNSRSTYTPRKESESDYETVIVERQEVLVPYDEIITRHRKKWYAGIISYDEYVKFFSFTHKEILKRSFSEVEKLSRQRCAEQPGCIFIKCKIEFPEIVTIYREPEKKLKNRKRFYR